MNNQVNQLIQVIANLQNNESVLVNLGYVASIATDSPETFVESLWDAIAEKSGSGH